MDNVRTRFDLHCEELNAQTIKATKSEENELLSIRWEWESTRDKLLRQNVRDANDLRQLETLPNMLLSYLECHLEASIAHKQLIGLGMHGESIDRLQKLLSEQADPGWPKDLEHLDLSAEAGRAGHLQAFTDLLDEFSIPPDQLLGRFVSVLFVFAAHVGVYDARNL